MDIIKTPQTDIQAFLYNEINIEIFEELTTKGLYENLFNPLDFFNILYSEFKIYYENDENYLIVKNHFTNFPYDDNLQRFYHIWALNEIILEYYTETKGLNGIQLKCFKIIKKLYLDLHKSLFLDFESEFSQFDFEKTKKVLSIIENINDKIIFLIEQKTEYKQHIEELSLMELFDDPNDLKFEKKCDLEIEKLKELLILETPQQTEIFEPQQSKSNIQNTLKFHGTPLEFTELIKPLIELKKISPELTQKEVFNRLKIFFELDDFNENEKLKDIRKRTNTPTPFLNTIEKTLNNWIKRKD